MQVLPEFQRQGIGRKLLEGCLPRISGSVCYCIPWRYLERFYGSVGFSRIEIEEGTRFLVERLARYRADGHDVILMRRANG
jgi:GNAT superfamily N-acetyltransferase